MTEKSFILIGGSTIELNTATYGTFNNLVIQSVQGDFNCLNIEVNDYILFENDLQYESTENSIVTVQKFIKKVNTTLGEDILTMQNNLINSIYTIKECSTRIRYLLGLDNSLIPTYIPSNKGSPFIVIDTNLSTGLYLQTSNNKAQSGSIASITANMFYTNSPFSLDSFQMLKVSYNTLTKLIFQIKGIHDEILNFKSPIKWLITLY